MDILETCVLICVGLVACLSFLLSVYNLACFDHFTRKTEIRLVREKMKYLNFEAKTFPPQESKIFVSERSFPSAFTECHATHQPEDSSAGAAEFASTTAIFSPVKPTTAVFAQSQCYFANRGAGRGNYILVWIKSELKEPTEFG